METRVDVINNLISTNNLKSYLEIGFQYGISFRAVECDRKVSVDPNPLSEGCTHKMTSDKFFEQNKESFDITFIDGDHSFAQSFADFYNALACTNRFIVFHDSNPPTAAHASLEPTMGEWCGEVFKTVALVKQMGFDVVTHPFDFGVTVVDLWDAPEIFYPLNYETFNRLR